MENAEPNKSATSPDDNRAKLRAELLIQTRAIKTKDGLFDVPDCSSPRSDEDDKEGVAGMGIVLIAGAVAIVVFLGGWWWILAIPLALIGLAVAVVISCSKDMWKVTIKAHGKQHTVKDLLTKKEADELVTFLTELIADVLKQRPLPSDSRREVDRANQ